MGNYNEQSVLSEDGVIAFAAIVGQILLEIENPEQPLEPDGKVIRDRLEALAVYAIDYGSEPPLSEAGKMTLKTLQVTVDQILAAGRQPLIPIRLS